MTTTRTQAEIIGKIQSFNEFDDIFGTQRGDLIEFLTFENASDFLKPEVTEEQWNTVVKEATVESAKKEIKTYMSFAWEKANDMRGLSASRSIDHMMAWLWIAGDGAFLEKIEAIPYEHYGKEKLIAICEYFDIDWKQWDNGERTNG